MLLQNKEVLEKCTELWDKIKNQIETISCDKPCKYEKHFMKIIEKNESKYLIFPLTENNKEELGLYKKLWSEIKKQIKGINSGKSIKYKNNFMKIRLDSYNDLPLEKILCFSVLNILCESVFQIENEYYQQIHINECEDEKFIKQNFYASVNRRSFKTLLFITLDTPQKKIKMQLIV